MSSKMKQFLISLHHFAINFDCLFLDSFVCLWISQRHLLLQLNQVWMKWNWVNKIYFCQKLLNFLPYRVIVRPDLCVLIWISEFSFMSILRNPATEIEKQNYMILNIILHSLHSIHPKTFCCLWSCMWMMDALD